MPLPAIERSFSVPFRHRVLFTDNAFAPDNRLLADLIGAAVESGRGRVLVVVDEGLVQAQPGLLAGIQRYFDTHAAVMEMAGPALVMEGGERAKNAYFHVSEVHSQIDRRHLDRHSYVLGIGGGGFLDMAGLAAATAHRGLRHIRMPSTTLAQCDSGIGVKNGINAFGKKNFIGTFAPPFAVINDFSLLDTLAERDRRAGYSEAVKVALIRDRQFFAALEREADALAAFEPGATRRLIHRCAELHVEHIATGGDPFESGSARPLDFGHWSAHKLEQLSGFSLRHGEAVAVGLALDVIYSRRAGLLDASSADRILALLRKLGFALAVPELGHTDAAGSLLVLEGLREFQEHLGGRLSITLLREIGQPVEAHEMDAARVAEAVAELLGR